MCCEGDVHCGIWHIDGVILHHAVPPRQMVNAIYDCMFLHLHQAFRRKRWHLVLQNPIILHDNAGSHHHCCCHRSLVLLAMGDSGTSTVLTQYEFMWLRSLRRSERTTTRDPVQHNRWTYLCHRAVNMDHQQRLLRWWLRCFPYIWRKVINKGGDYIEGI